MATEELFAVVFVSSMFAGVLVLFMAMRQRSQRLEMLHRERMAMIERGQPPPAGLNVITVPATASRSLSLGIVVVALGLALMTVIGIAAEAPGTGIGIGGAIAIVGAGFIVNSMVARHGAPGRPQPPADQFPEL